MHGYIYKITNQINGKVYIGQTKTSIRRRWTAHKSRYNQGYTCGIYGAMKKYGIENFQIEEIIQCPIEDLDILEQFYIQKYNSYNDGYNLTLGGDGAKTLNLDEIEVINKYKELGYVKDVAKFFNCCDKVISNILHNNNIEIKYKPRIIHYTPEQKQRQIEHGRKTGCKKIKIIELNKTFPSILECGKWLIENNYCNTQQPNLAQRSISRVLNGDRKSYCKLHFEYL